MRTDHARELRHQLTDAEDICKRLGLCAHRYQRQPGGVIVRCPWHEDRKPSCSVRLSGDGTLGCKCFACGASGDVLGLIAHVRGLSTKGGDFTAVLLEAAHLAGDFARVAELEGGAARPRSPSPPPPPPLRIVPPPGLDVDVFHELASLVLAGSPLRGNAAVAGYLAGRCLLDEAEAAGWGALPGNPRPLAARIVAKMGEDVARRSGLLRLAFGHWGFVFDDHRLVIPYRDGAHRIVTLQRRLVRPSAGPDDPKYVFPKGRAGKLYIDRRDIERHHDRPAVAFVEGALDALALRALTTREGVDVLVLGIPGTGGWRAEWAEWARGRAVYVALDNDPAGDKRAAQMFGDLGCAREAKRWRPLDGAKDWAEQLAAGVHT